MFRAFERDHFKTQLFGSGLSRLDNKGKGVVTSNWITTIDLHLSCLHNLCKNDRYLICQLNPLSINAVDLFPHIIKIGLSSQLPASYFYSIKQQTLESPLLLVFFIYYFSTLDINTTHSTWLELMGLMSDADFYTRCMREHINRFFAVFWETEVWGYISTNYIIKERHPDNSWMAQMRTIAF